jgi:hypothetical protein
MRIALAVVVLSITLTAPPSAHADEITVDVLGGAGVVVGGPGEIPSLDKVLGVRGAWFPAGSRRGFDAALDVAMWDPEVDDSSFDFTRVYGDALRARALVGRRWGGAERRTHGVGRVAVGVELVYLDGTVETWGQGDPLTRQRVSGTAVGPSFEASIGALIGGRAGFDVAINYAHHFGPEADYYTLDYGGVEVALRLMVRIN